jgi:hypothetical protein
MQEGQRQGRRSAADRAIHDSLFVPAHPCVAVAASAGARTPAGACFGKLEHTGSATPKRVSETGCHEWDFRKTPP